MLKLHRSGVLALVCFLWSVAASPAQQSPLDLIPEDAAFGFGVRNLAGLRDKGDQFFKDYPMKNLSPDYRPSSLFALGFKYLKIDKGLDEKGSVALIFPSFKKVGITNLTLESLQYFIIAVPFTDADTVASNFGFKAGALVAGKIETAGGQFLLIKNKHLFMCQHKKALEWLAVSKPLQGEMSAVQRSTLDKADLVIHFGPQNGDLLWKILLESLTAQLRKKGTQANDEVFRQFVAALGQVRFVTAGLRLEDGLVLNVIASFPKTDSSSAATKFMTGLRAGPGTSDLIGLAARDPLFIYAAKGHGGSNVHMIRALLDILFDKSPALGQALPLADWHNFLDIFEATFKRLKGSRAAVYRVGKSGGLAGVAILDLDDPEAFQDEWGKLVEIANKAALKAVGGKQDNALKLKYTPRAETVDGTRVDLLIAEIPGLAAEETRVLQQLLGPDWNKLLMAVQDKSVVVLLGSERDLLKETLRNRKQGAAGLAKNKVVAGALSRLAPERKLELHANLKFWLALTGLAIPAGDTVEGLTSFALTAELDRLQLDVAVPKSEVKVFVQIFGLKVD